MTSSANDQWNYEKLQHAIYRIRLITDSLKEVKDAVIVSEISAFCHAIDFIEYNMREMEIKPSTNNGD